MGTKKKAFENPISRHNPGPPAGQQFRRALAISQGDRTIFSTHPISAGVFATHALVQVGPPLWERFARRKPVMARAALTRVLSDDTPPPTAERAFL